MDDFDESTTEAEDYIKVNREFTSLGVFRENVLKMKMTWIELIYLSNFKVEILKNY